LHAKESIKSSTGNFILSKDKEIKPISDSFWDGNNRKSLNQIEDDLLMIDIEI